MRRRLAQPEPTYAPAQEPLGAAELRRIAVLADADPRSVRKVALGGTVRGTVHHRITRALRELGYLEAGA